MKKSIKELSEKAIKNTQTVKGGEVDGNPYMRKGGFVVIID